MLIDDDEATNFLNAHIIKKQEITEQLLIAHNGVNALNVLKSYQQKSERTPELIFLDINMPVMNGFEFLEALDELYPDYRQSGLIVMLTTSLNPDDIKRVSALGITEFITKPLSKRKLNSLIDKHFTDGSNIS